MSRALNAHHDLIKKFWQNIEWASTEWGILSQALKDRFKISCSDELTLNASIYLHRTQDVSCTVNRGTALAMWDMFMQMAATAEINGVGTSDYLVAEHNHKNDRFTDYTWLLTHPDPERLVPQIMPRDALRREIGNQLVSLATLFLVLHEEAHYSCGHLHLLNNMGLCPELRECPSKLDISMVAGIKNHKALKKIFELEADHLALVLLLFGGQDADVLKSTRLGKRMNQNVWNNLTMLVISSLCCAFELADRRSGINAEMSTHPSAGCRWLNLLGGYKHFIEAETGHTPSPTEFELILDNLSIAARTFSVVPLTMEDIRAVLFAGANPPKGGPAEEFLVLSEQVDHSAESDEWSTARREAHKSIDIDMDVQSNSDSQKDSKPSDFAIYISQLTLDTLQNRRRRP